MNDANLAYIAGLFDGEGSVYFKQTKQIDTIVKANPHTMF